MFAADIQVVGNYCADLGEGPCWDDRLNSIVWVDIPRGFVLVFSPAENAQRVIDVGSPVGAVVLRRAGGYVLAARDGFLVLESEMAVPRLMVSVEADRRDTRMNDGKCDRSGRFWAGTMAEDERPGQGSLYRLECDGAVTKVLEDVTVSNGLAWNADDTALYYVDSATYGIDVFDYEAETGSISHRRRLVTLASGEGMPDGLTIDEEGCLWVALWGGAAVRRYTPAGVLDRTIEFPTSLITSVAFGGADLADLYVTSASAYLPEGERARQPLAGRLFKVTPGVRGVPANAFGGA